MKTTMLFIAASLVIGMSSCSKSGVSPNTPAGNTANVVPASSVPVAARNTFAANFTGATEVEWQHNSSHEFEVQFNHSAQRHEAHFDDNGNQTSHSINCLDAPVPSVVLDAFRANYPTDNAYEWKLTSAGTWKAHIMRGTTKYEATFSASGSLIKFEQAG